MDGARTSIALPPVTRGASPEYQREPDPAAPRQKLLELASRTGGSELAALTGLFEGPPSREGRRSLQPILLLSALLLFLAEIAVRRLALFPKRRRAAPTESPEPQPEAAAEAPPPTEPQPEVEDMSDLLRRLKP